jgi:hypothetical protein
MFFYFVKPEVEIALYVADPDVSGIVLRVH